MSFSINTNITSLQAQNYLNVSTAFQSKTIGRVTSGLRIVQSGDDAAGLAIANGIRSDQTVLTQGIRNANDGLSQLQIADGGLSNISQLLDRARTLATQSSSGTFTGNRTTLNAEFQSVLTEINRQAQSIGLDTGGTFAKSLSVFIGGGKANNGVSATQNGSVAIDLSQSTVDSKSLGLQGVQAIGTAGTDIGAGSANTSLSQVLANATNSSSTQVANFTTFYVKGPGFDSNGIKISVNTQNLGGTAGLVSAVNAAIASAAAGGTQQATALQNAQITASVNTDATGKQQLAFTSSTSAFQVEAGDRVANALLGNFAQNATTVGTDTNATLDTTTNHSLTFKFDGSATAVTVAITNSIATSKGQIVNDLNANAGFAAAGVASLQGNQIVIQSKNTGGTSQVFVDHTAVLSQTLGLATSGADTTATAAAASTGASLATTVQGQTGVAGAQNLISTVSSNALTPVTGVSDTFTLTVGANTGTVTLAGGTNLTAAQVAADINSKTAAAGFTGANAFSASVVNNQLVLTAAQPGNNITIGAGNADAVLGFANAAASAGNVFATASTIQVQFQGSGLTAPVTLSLTPTVAGTTTTAQVLANLQTQVAANTQLAAAGISLSTASTGDNLIFSSNKGEQFTVTATGDTENKLGLGSFQAGGAVDATTVTAGSTYSTGIGSGSGTANLQISLNGNASNANTISANLAAGPSATSGVTTGVITYAAGVVNLSGDVGTDKLALKIDGGVTILTGTFGASATTTVATILSVINTALGAAGTATINGSGNLVLTSSTKGATSSIEIVAAGAGASDANLLTKLGLAAGVNRGANESVGDAVNQLNTAIAGNSSLTAAGIVASNVAGAVTLTSSNNTFFRVGAYGSGNLGFGNSGATFTGNAASGAPVSSPAFDSQGANATAQLAFTGILTAADTQSIAITANDSSGAKHSLSVTLSNNTTSRNGQSIDSAINAINTALRQSNDSTLQQVVAVKDDVSGSQKIRFVSTLSTFQVDTASTPGGTGITPPTGNVSTAAALGLGANASIADQASAQAAVSALSVAVANLGNAQAVVGRGENQFNFAVNLAQSQLTNLAAAESRIRDADLAAESANLTKAQILVQAGVAALAQANSAPQAVLSLLQGR